VGDSVLDVGPGKAGGFGGILDAKSLELIEFPIFKVPIQFDTPVSARLEDRKMTDEVMARTLRVVTEFATPVRGILNRVLLDSDSVTIRSEATGANGAFTQRHSPPDLHGESIRYRCAAENSEVHARRALADPIRADDRRLDSLEGSTVEYRCAAPDPQWLMVKIDV
jgi:hypothetical protein